MMFLAATGGSHRSPDVGALSSCGLVPVVSGVLASMSTMDTQTLQRLTLTSGMGMRIPIRTVFQMHQQIKTQSTGNAFTVFYVYVVDSSGHYSVVQRAIFGTQEARQKTLQDMQSFFSDSKVFLMSKVSGVERNKPQFTCVSAPNIIRYDRVGRPNATACFTPQLLTSSVATQLPKTIEPRETLADLLRITDKRTVNFMALVASSETPSNMAQEMVKVTLADETGRIQVKFWGDRWRGVFAEKDGWLVCGFNFWASLGDTSEGNRATPSLRALASVEVSHLLWPTEKDLSREGKGRRLLAKREEIFETVTQCLTEEGTGYDPDSPTNETAEATATVVALMELTNKYLQALPDSLFQLQGAFITLSPNGAESMWTKDRYYTHIYI